MTDFRKARLPRNRKTQSVRWLMVGTVHHIIYLYIIKTIELENIYCESFNYLIPILSVKNNKNITFYVEMRIFNYFWYSVVT